MSQSNTASSASSAPAAPVPAAPVPAATTVLALANTTVCQLLNADDRVEDSVASKKRSQGLIAKSADARVDADRKIANMQTAIANLQSEKKRRILTEDGFRKAITKANDSITKNKNFQKVLQTARLSIDYEDQPQDLKDYQIGRKKKGPDGIERRIPGRTKWLTTPKKFLLDAIKGRVNLTDDQLGELKDQCADGKGTSLTCVVMLAKDPRAARAGRAAADLVALEAENAENAAALRAKCIEFEALQARLVALEQQQPQPPTIHG